MDDLTLSFLRAIVSLSVTLGLIVLVGHAYKRWGTNLRPLAKPTARLSLIESKRLNPQTTLHLIKLDDTEHLIATTSGATTLLSTHTSTPAKPVKKK